MSRPQVVITRKDKRINHKLMHAAAFAVTGGVSGLVTAAEVANHAAYNARTRQLQAQSESQPGRARWQRCSYCRAWPNDPRGHGPGCPNT